MSSGHQDPDHIDGALALAERGLVVQVVTYDLGMELTCDRAGLRATRLVSEADLPED